MGGFADYSGSLVLQLPVDLACHVALQFQSCSTARRWHNMLPSDSSSVARPSIRLVSLFADRENRCDALCFFGCVLVFAAHMGSV